MSGSPMGTVAPPPRPLRAALAGLALFYGLLWVGGIVSYVVWGGPPEGSGWAAPAYLMVGALLVAVAEAAAPPAGRAGAGAALRRVAVLGAVGLVGYLSEVSGVHTGFPFGGYAYTDHLGPHLLGVPPVLAAAWVLLATHGEAVARRLVPPVGGPGRSALVVGAAAVWMTAVDLLIDPLAAGPLGYWRWEQEGPWFGVPLSNFAGWLLVSAVLQGLMLLAPRTPGRTRGPDPSPARSSVPAAAGRGPAGAFLDRFGGPGRVVGLSVVAFFTAVALLRGLLAPAAVGAVLLVLDLGLGRLVARRSPSPSAGSP